MEKDAFLARVYENITYLIKLRGAKVGDVEKAIGVSAGYLSRSNGVDFPISKVAGIAYHFNISVDALLYGRYKVLYFQQKIDEFKSELKAEENS